MKNNTTLQIQNEGTWEEGGVRVAEMLTLTSCDEDSLLVWYRLFGKQNLHCED